MDGSARVAVHRTDVFMSLFAYLSCPLHFKTTQYEQQPEGVEQVQVESGNSPSPAVGEKRPREDEDESTAAQMATDLPAAPRANVQLPTGPAAMNTSNGVGITQGFGTPNTTATTTTTQNTSGLSSIASDALYIGDLQWVSLSGFLCDDFECTLISNVPVTLFNHSGLRTKIFDRWLSLWE